MELGLLYQLCYYKHNAPNGALIKPQRGYMFIIIPIPTNFKAP